MEDIVTKSIFHAVRERLVSEGYLFDLVAIDYDNPTDTPEETKLKTDEYEQGMKDIANTKGYAIELFSFSNSQTKGYKKVPRIVIDIQFIIPGNLGNEVAKYYEKTGNYYISKQSQPILSDLTFMVYAVGNSAKQMVVMNQLILQSLPTRGYIKLYSEDFKFSQNLFVDLIDKGKTDGLQEGTIERWFKYQIPDITEIDERIISDNIAPINDINLETIIK